MFSIKIDGLMPIRNLALNVYPVMNHVVMLMLNLALVMEVIMYLNVLDHQYLSHHCTIEIKSLVNQNNMY